MLITGATSGLGRELARQLARRRLRLALTGRREELLEEACREMRGLGADAVALPGSVTDPAAVRAGYSRVKELWGGLDWAVLNAAVGVCNDARDFKAGDYHEKLSTNVGGAANWIEAVLPDMIAARRGTIAGIASLDGFRGLPGSGSYCASKAALIAMLESMRVDLAGTGVRVVAVCPGYIATGMTDPVRDRTWFMLGPEEAARRVIDGIEAGAPLVAFPWPPALFMRLVLRNMPCRLYDLLIRKLI